MTFDYVGARKIVNGTDKAEQIAEIARKFYTRLKNGELQGGSVTEVKTTDVLKDINATSGNPIQALAANVLAPVLADQKTGEQLSTAATEANKFSTIMVSLGYTGGSFVDYTFIWTGIKLDHERMTLSGQSVDVVIAENTITDETRTYKNTSLKQFAQSVANEQGIKLELEESDLVNQNIETINQFSGESKYQTLGRIAKSKGYFLRNSVRDASGSALTLEPIIANASTFVLSPYNFIKYPVFSEKAEPDRITGKGLAPIVEGLKKVNKDLTNGSKYATSPTSDLETAILRVFVSGNDDASGFIFDPAGLFLTNEHVSRDALGYVILKDGTKQENVTYLAQDDNLDLAIGKLPERSEPYPYLKLSSEPVQVGDKVTAIGNPATKDPWYKSTGTVTATDSFGSVKAATIATTANFIEPGNSGCPVFAGISGMVVAISESMRQSDRTGRLVPISTAIDFINKTTSTQGSAGNFAKLSSGAAFADIQFNDNATNTELLTVKNPIATAKAGLSEIANILTDTGLVQIKDNKVTNIVNGKDTSVSTAKLTDTNAKTDADYVSNVTEGQEIGKGFEIQLSYMCDAEVLKIKPGDIITMPPYYFDSKISGEYRVGSIEHGDGNQSSIELYKPVWVKPKSKSGVNNSSLSKGSTVLNQPTQGEVTNASQLENLASIKFIKPLPTGVISSYFGYRFHPIYGTRKRHNGDDVAAPEGDPIYAVAAGVVAYAAGDNKSGYGNYVLIYHGSVAGKKIFCLYGHCSQVLVTTGQLVNQNEKISLCGSTGQSTGAHLHFGCTYGADWGMNDASNFPDNASNVWISPTRNFIEKTFDGNSIDTTGQTDDGST